MPEKTLATFRLDPEQWERFKAKCNDSGFNATQAISALIDAVLDEKISLDSLKPLGKDIGSISEISALIDGQLSPLKAEIEALRVEVEVLKKIPQKKPREDATQAAPKATAVRSVVRESGDDSGDVPSCPHCGSMDTRREGYGKLRADGTRSPRVRCITCGKTTVLKR